MSESAYVKISEPQALSSKFTACFTCSSPTTARRSWPITARIAWLDTMLCVAWSRGAGDRPRGGSREGGLALDFSFSARRFAAEPFGLHLRTLSFLFPTQTSPCLTRWFLLTCDVSLHSRWSRLVIGWMRLELCVANVQSPKNASRVLSPNLRLRATSQTDDRMHLPLVPAMFDRRLCFAILEELEV